MAKFGAIIATMENLEEAAILANAEEGIPAQETATEVAEVSGDVDIGETDIDQTDTAIESAEGAQDQIGELIEVAEDSLTGDAEEVAKGEVGQEGEGLSENEVSITNDTLESIMNTLGIENTRLTYTTESFSNKTDRRQATIDTLEDLTAKAKDIGSKIVAALKAALNTVVNFLVGLLKNRAIMEKHLANLSAKIKTVAGKQKEKDTFSHSAITLSIDGKASVESAMTLLNDANTLIKVSENVAGALNGNTEGILAAAQSGGQESYSLTNGRKMTIAASEDGVKFDIQSGQTSKEIEAPDEAAMSKLIARALVVIKDLRRFEGTQNKLKSAVQAIIGKLNQAVNTVKDKFTKKPEGVGDTGEAGGESEAAAAKKNARLARQVMNKVGGTFPAAAFQAVKGVADYVTAGINNYKAPQAAQAAQAAEPAQA